MSMPSVFTSLAGASQDTLEQVLAEREFRRVQAEQAAEAQRKMQMDAMNMQLRLRGDQRAQSADQRAAESLGLQRQRFEADQAQTKDTTDAKAREQATRLGIIDMVRQGGDQLDPAGRRLMAAEGGLPITTFDVPESPADRLKRIEAETDVRARTNAKYRKGAGDKTRVAKDNPKVPARFLETIQNRIGSTGFGSIDEAIQSIEGRWPEWRKNYPGLDLNAMRLALQNLYGKKPKSGGSDDLAASIAEKIESRLSGQP